MNYSRPSCCAHLRTTLRGVFGSAILLSACSAQDAIEGATPGLQLSVSTAPSQPTVARSTESSAAITNSAPSATSAGATPSASASTAPTGQTSANASVSPGLPPDSSTLSSTTAPTPSTTDAPVPSATSSASTHLTLAHQEQAPVLRDIEHRECVFACTRDKYLTVTMHYEPGSLLQVDASTLEPLARVALGLYPERMEVLEP